jgi:preprotein translocase SecE subunit
MQVVQELAKVKWPTFPEVVNAAVAVLAGILVATAFVFVTSYAFQRLLALLVTSV